MTFNHCCNRCGSNPCRCSCNHPVCRICVGPTGPTGPTGATGADGATGPTGATGADATITPGAAVADVPAGSDTDTLIASFNALLASLRAAGLLEN